VHLRKQAIGYIHFFIYLTNPKVDYYCSGQFGEANCKFCGALLLSNEALSIKQGRHSPCCSNGQCNTEQMKAEFDDLQNPPKLFRLLLGTANPKILEEFCNNTMTLNNTFAFASVHSSKAAEDQMGGRMDTIKYNGLLTFLSCNIYF